jgi:transcriptional activator
VARPPGYLLNLAGDGTDARAAERLLRQGRQAADPAQGARDLREALGLWRGPPLADVTGSAWLEEQSQRLDLLAGEVRRALFEARLAAGEHAELVAGLEEAAAGDPLDEQVHGQLMLALYRCGRQADALAVFGRLRAALAEQLGIDPSPALRELQTAILRQDEALAVPARSQVPRGARPVPAPAQLPPAVPGFAGRGAELARLDAVLAQAQRECSAGSAAVVISAVSGTAGWARRRWRCSGRTGWRHGSPTDSSMSTCAGSTPVASQPNRPRRCADSWTRSGCRRPASPTLCRPRPRCTAACSRASGCWSCWTTRAAPSRSARCCPAHPDAWRS